MRSLRPTSAYGIRKYLEGSVLHDHVDVLNTHVLSAVYVVESFNLTQPWYMEMVPDFAGDSAKLDLHGGQVMLYESAKLPHGRPSVLTGPGAYYASVFVHYKPKWWSMANEDRVYAVDPSTLRQSWDGVPMNEALMKELWEKSYGNQLWDGATENEEL